MEFTISEIINNNDFIKKYYNYNLAKGDDSIYNIINRISLSLSIYFVLMLILAFFC